MNLSQNPSGQPTSPVSPEVINLAKNEASPADEVVKFFSELAHSSRDNPNYAAIDYAMNLVAGAKYNRSASKERTRFHLTIEQISKPGFLEDLHPDTSLTTELSSKINDMNYLTYDKVRESLGAGNYAARKELAVEITSLLLTIINGADEDDFLNATKAKPTLH